MNAQNIKEAFEVRANEIGFCLDQHWGQYENPYINNDTALAYNLFKDGWTAANSIRDEELNGCVVVPEAEYNLMTQFKDLYKRAIVNAKKRKNQINWAHVAGLGVGSGRAVELCKELNIDPHATDMNAMLEAARGGKDG
ncbi:hypothetical protein MMO39_04640 [Acinetobacter modestus]|uniref:hypothetical protein n=1 Tax=Acinetobacter modestus TaxID=1776740 RepID=UPI001F4A7E37|nr:hypothetical protein [Acinetobacter modestus]MCH7386588.1 hypothetical protein [Acinetobacter modestus]